MKRRTALLISAAVLLGAACGGDDDDATEASATPASAAATDGAPAGSAPSDASSPAGSAAPAAAGSVATNPDGVLRFGHYYEPSRMDPHRAANAGDGLALFITYDRLVHLDEDSNPIPGLAESWEYSADGTTLTFHVREGVTFHDGTAFDAAAVKANIERAKTVEGSVVANDLAPIESVDVIDPMTVQLTLSAPNAALLGILSDRAGAMISPAAFDKPDLDRAPVGAGMYTVTDYKPGDRIVFTRYDGYWDPAAQGAAEIDYILIGDSSTRLNALRSGQLDTAVLEPGDVEDAESAGMSVTQRSTVQYQQMYMNRADPPFDDVNVRRALNYAIDRQGIVDAVDFGFGEPNSQIFPEGYWAFNDEIGTDFYTYDPDRARELLAESAHPDGFAFDMLLPTPGTPPQIAEILQASFAELGITMNIIETPAQEVADRFFVRKDVPTLLGVWTGRADPSMTTSLRWTSTGFTNPGGGTTPEIEALNQTALETIDPDARTDAMHELVAAGTEEAFDLVIYNPVISIAATDAVAQAPTIILNGKLEFRGAGMN
ncbi:MAG TPA: ABC transporter substrate-binding protein [Ilumatobacteraceae bacterium]|nr:ABC transporter substrate-binding protein [Ilumatobacteraceae bacterium]